MIINQSDDLMFEKFVQYCGEIGVDTNIIKQVASNNMAKLKQSKVIRTELKLNDQYERRWYASLASGSKPYYEVYDTDYYLAETFVCWAFYSKKYIKVLLSDKSLINRSIFSDLQSITSVTDLGCGIGLTTASFKQLFPNIPVVGTNIEQTTQYKICKKFSQDYGFQMQTDLSGIKPGGLVFASEYFEHIESPIEHLIDVIKSVKPSRLLIANAFGAKAVGHFNFYKFNGKQYTGKQISKIFNDALRKFGYEKVPTKLWNSRPTYWRLKAK